MKKSQLLFLLILFFLTIKGTAQQKYTISGYIRSSESGEALIGATVQIKELYKSAMANAYGFYSITLSGGKHSVQYSYLGYMPSFTIFGQMIILKLL
jgi:capsule polysaccharide export protein KpsE/RkpR